MTTINDFPYLARMEQVATHYGMRNEFRTQRFFGKWSAHLDIFDDKGTHDKLTYSSWFNPETKRLNNYAHLWSMGAGVGTPITLRKANAKLDVWCVARAYMEAR